MSVCKSVVYLIDDDSAIRKALSRTISLHGLEVESFASAREFLDGYVDKPGCLVLDLSMPGMSGLELQEELVRLNVDIPIIFITGHGSVPESVKAVRAGAIDFLEKPFLPEILLQRIDEALQQDQTNRSRNKEHATIRDRFSRLTEREREVLRLLVESDTVPSSKVMARELDISHRTVEHHRSSILEKTHTSSAPELRALFRQYGIELPDKQ